jgi:tripartite motif-containing protein 71
MFHNRRFARSRIIVSTIFVLLLALQHTVGLAQTEANDPRGPIAPPPVFKTPDPVKPNPNKGISSADPAGFSDSASVAPLRPITPQVGFLSSGFRSIHYNDRASGSFTFPFFVTADNDYFFVSDSAGHVVKLYQVTSTGATLIRTFGSTQGAGAGQFNGPEQVAVVGNDIYVTDFLNNRVQRFNKNTGAYVSQFGSSGSGAGQFGNPTGIVYNPVDGLLYVSDIVNDRIQKFSTAGIYQGQFGSFGSGNGQLNNPWGLAVDSFGYVYVADNINDRIVKFANTGTWIRNIATGAAADGVLAIAIDRANMLWFTNIANNVYAYDSNGSYRLYYYGANSDVWPEGYFNSVRGIAVTPPLTIAPYEGKSAVIIADGNGQTVSLFMTSFQSTAHPAIRNVTGISGFIGGFAFDSQENVYFTASSENKVYKYDKFGALITSWGATGTGNGQFNFPFGITIDDDDNVYVSDYNNNRIQKFNSSGGYLLQWGSFGTGDGQFNNPAGLATDGSFVYVADESNDRVQKFGLTGVWVRKWGTVGTGNGQMDGPAGIAVDRRRNLVYVAEFQNDRIQQFNVFGDFVKIFTENNGTALNGTVGITTDQRGNLYVADRFNNRVMQFNDNGTYLATFPFNNANAIGINPKNVQLYVGANSGGAITQFGATVGKSDTIGVYRPSNQTFLLRNALSGGAPFITSTVQFAQTTDLPVTGDWNGDGIDTPGIYRPSSSFFYLWDSWHNPSMSTPSYLVLLGNPNDQGIAGDWDGDGKDSVGTYRRANGILYLKNALTNGFSEYFMVLGNPSDTGIAGDWNLDGAGNAGIFRPSEARFYLTNRNTNGIVFDDGAYFLGFSTDVPFTGDWTNSGYAGIGVFRPSTGTMFLKYNLDNTPSDLSLAFGASGDLPLSGIWGASITSPDQQPDGNAAPPPNNSVIKPFTAISGVIVPSGTSGGTNAGGGDQAD